ncbi:BamA/TamA family outer membrane protein [Hymenobacter busanensis]|uniref:BamA/TamA family outer membrane protein n=1 Tax=Hymenobacter busanensis TaxID=2607656 RepID=A0A7L4ZXQ4_9BACT|nr:BamA/TamA family outer membrane protein [Hymenobacter busanensis]KAA9333036.1 BamA/TamA family outer membrane protein [Hymenobacter busanensis]QHJ08289.1 BamA/TamA family outer membrane protein [Hymenobacter busanensis]
MSVMKTNTTGTRPTTATPGTPVRHRALQGTALAALLLLAACSGTRFIPENDKLYTGSTVKITSPYPIQKEAELQTELETVITPKPNASILGLRPKLYFWHMGQGKSKGLGHFLAEKYGEAPVLLSQVDTQKVKGLMINRLYNNGYFAGPRVQTKPNAKGRTATIDYTATVQRAYTIKEIHFPERDTLLDRDIRKTQPGSLLKVGEPYNLNTLITERSRIDDQLKQNGYYFFNPDYILYEVDSTEHNQVDVYLRVKGNIPRRASQSYVLNRVTLNTRYGLTDTTESIKPIMYKGYRYVPDEKVFKAKAITGAVFLFPDSLYRRRRQDQTLSRLMSLGTFKFVDIQFRQARQKPDSAGYGFLNASVRMTQLKKKSLRAEVQLVSKTNGFTGPGFTAQFRNRSALRGAEQLLVNVVGSFETRQGTGSSNTGVEGTTGPVLGLTSFELGANAQLLVPRLITPPLPFLDVTLRNSDFQPRTSFGVGYRYVERRQFFQEDFFNLNYGYSWKTKITNEQELRPIDLQYIRLAKTTPEFDKLLESRPFLANSFRQQFIPASSYRYTYNTQVYERRRNQLYFNGGLELAGNLASAINKLTGAARNDSGRYEIIGQEFSQYTKLDLEYRNYYRITQNPTSGNKIATRLLIGLGMPYGNSDVMPYLKQYGVGGPNSVRAFAPREVGPGSYKPTNSSVSSRFYDQVGDIRLEANVEYRQDLFPYVKGALFMDAGNVWLVNDDKTRPGGQFKPGSFLNELAIGAGAGVRVDIQFLVIRLDVAYPLRVPYGGSGGGSLVPNLAIGYPF